VISLALYHPQIPQNTGTLMRLSACFGIRLLLIRPFGFLLDDRRLKRACMDYSSFANYEICDSFEIFREKYGTRRSVALDVGNHVAHNRFSYKEDDILVAGSEHYGFLPQDLEKIPDRVKIPMLPNRRSLNMAIAATVVISEVMSRLNLFPI
jgi:tRNA (cytidine/uridine-2'-O-)-methyltransferase